MVSSGADGQVRLGLAGEGGSVRTRCVARHNGRAHKLALVPGAAGWVLSCGEDGRVLSMDVQRGGPAIALVEVKSPQASALIVLWLSRGGEEGGGCCERGVCCLPCPTRLPTTPMFAF